MRRYDLNGRGRLDVLIGPRVCTACGKPTEVVLWSARGYFKSVCRPCRKDYSLTHDEFLDSGAFDAISCPECERPLTPRISELESGAYLLDCSECRHFIRMADLLPLMVEPRQRVVTSLRKRQL